MIEVTYTYIDGILEGRALLKRLIAEGIDIAEEIPSILDNIRETSKISSQTVRELLRGERDFWNNQAKLYKE